MIFLALALSTLLMETVAFACAAVGIPDTPTAPPPPPPPPPWTGQPAVQTDGSIFDNDYPKAAIRDDQSGTTTVRFAIGVDGKPRRCVIHRTSGSDALDLRSCELVIQRFRFRPAQDSRGKAIEEFRVQRITWRFPDDGSDEITTYEPASQLLSYDVDDKGAITNCRAVYSDDPEAARWACPDEADIHLDGNGRPIAVRIRHVTTIMVEPSGNDSIAARGTGK